MYIVYILKSINHPLRHYVGITVSLDERLKEHNRGDSLYTKRYAPWFIETYVCFRSEVLAQKFERYLKEGSGHSFLKRHLI